MNRFLIPLLTALTLLMPFLSLAEACQLDTPDSGNLLVIRGRVVCLDASGRSLDGLFGCNDPAARFALADKDAKLYYFAPTGSGAAIFKDARVRARELQITAQLDRKNFLEIIRVQSIREGKLHDIYYFCELCNIRAYAPGLCPCCRNDLEFRETPA
jgi:hypothetical protein